VEGYVESIATGLLAGINAARLALGRAPVVAPRPTACGSLVHYLSSSSLAHFQPANISFGLLPEVSGDIARTGDRKERHRRQVDAALVEMDRWIANLGDQTSDLRLPTSDLRPPTMGAQDDIDFRDRRSAETDD